MNFEMVPTNLKNSLKATAVVDYTQNHKQMFTSTSPYMKNNHIGPRRIMHYSQVLFLYIKNWDSQAFQLLCSHKITFIWFELKNALRNDNLNDNLIYRRDKKGFW